MKRVLQPGERLEQLGQNLYIIQHEQGYRFSLDAVLVAGFVEPKPGENIFDLGTGSGVIPLLLWMREPNIKVIGLEIQARLVEQAQRSVTMNDLDDYITIMQGDLKELKREWLGQWDTVVTNPPFFTGRSGKVSPDKEKALARHELACNLEDIIMAAGKLLKETGRLVLIHRTERLPHLLKLFLRYEFSLLRLAFVHSTRELPAKLVLLEAVLGGGRTLTVLPAVVVYEKGRQYSPQIEALFAGGNLFG